MPFKLSPLVIRILLFLSSLFLAGRSFAESKIAVLTTGTQAGHYLTWRGKPILLIGDSVTQGWMECGANFHQDGYLDALARRGINLLMIWAYKATDASAQKADERIGYDAPEIQPWIGSTDARNMDLMRLNPAYFERLKALVAGAQSRGIVVLICVHDGWPKTLFASHPFNAQLGNGPLTDRRQYVELADYDREMPEAFDPSWTRQEKNQYFQERFCAKLIEDLQPFSNVLYEMFNEGEWYDKAMRRRHEERFLAFFRRRCDNLLLTNSDHITGDDPHANPNVDIVTYHGKWTGRFADFARGFEQRPARPYLFSEPVPSFDGTTPTLEAVMRCCWETALAGAGWANQNDTSFAWDRRTKMAARAEARGAAYDLAGHCARFFNASGVGFAAMRPMGRLSSTGLCLAQPGVEYVAYAPKGSAVTLDLGDAKGATFSVRWYDPGSGSFVIADPPIGGGGRRTFVPPFQGDDAVLHLLRRPGTAAGQPEAWAS